MSEKIFDAGVVSWTTFDRLFENQSDFCRKLGFLLKTARLTKEKDISMDLMFDLLNRKEKNLHEIREEALMERQEAGGPNVKVIQTEERLPPDELSEDAGGEELLGKIAEIRREGGYHWENLQAIIEGTYSTIRKSKGKS